jgi:retron-type reverse transcriptase
MDKISFEKMISVPNLLLAFKEFLRGKRNKKDVQEFQLHLMDNILSLHNDLKNQTYTHGGYHAFNISDPKLRNIHKALVRDRLLHHAIYRILYLYFDTKFIHDSYSCRINKGTHKAINRFRDFNRKVSKNNTRTCFVLKCDIKKFFANIDHAILKKILEKHIKDKNILWLLLQVINSFTSCHIYAMADIRKGLPLGNLTSQLLVNIYMNEFDQYVKRELKVKYYIRYADDFVILGEDKEYLKELLTKISIFLSESLKLSLHPDKVFIKTIASGGGRFFGLGAISLSQDFTNDYQKKDAEEFKRKSKRRNKAIVCGDVEAWECGKIKI